MDISRGVEFNWRYFLVTAIPCAAGVLRMVWLWIADPAGTIDGICGPGMCFLPAAVLMTVAGPAIAYPVLLLGSMSGAALARRAFANFSGPRSIAWLFIWLAAGISSVLPLTVLLLLDHPARLVTPDHREIFSLLYLLAQGAMVGLFCGTIYEFILQIEKSIDRRRKGPGTEQLLE